MLLSSIGSAIDRQLVTVSNVPVRPVLDDSS
jgi:hypothetical protein